MTNQRRPITLAVYSIAVFLFLYSPVAVLILYSFNGDGVGGFPPHNFTLAWYRILLEDDSLWSAVGNSVIVALAAVVIALAFGTPAALALDRASFPGKAAFKRLVLLPLILPGIITGLSLLMLFVAADIQLSLWTIMIGHGTALISVAVTEIFAGLQKFERAQEEAALDLGANYWQTLRHVTSAQSQTVHHRSRSADFYAFHGRNRGQLLPDRPQQHAAAGNLVALAPRDHSGNQRNLFDYLCAFPGHGSVNTARLGFCPRRCADRLWGRSCRATINSAMAARMSAMPHAAAFLFNCLFSCSPYSLEQAAAAPAISAAAVAVPAHPHRTWDGGGRSRAPSRGWPSPQRRSSPARTPG